MLYPIFMYNFYILNIIKKPLLWPRKTFCYIPGQFMAQLAKERCRYSGPGHLVQIVIAITPRPAEVQIIMFFRKQSFKSVQKVLVILIHEDQKMGYGCELNLHFDKLHDRNDYFIIELKLNFSLRGDKLSFSTMSMKYV